MTKKQAGPPFRHGPAQPPQASRGTIGGPMGAAPKALGIKNSALGSGTIGNGGSQGVRVQGGIKPGGPKPRSGK
jgi:hypothetical protein